MADAAILNFSTNRNNSAAIWAIVTKFGLMVDMDSPRRAVTPFLTYIKIKMAAGCHLEKGKSPYLSRFLRHLYQIWCAGTYGQSAACRDAKFYVMVDMDSSQRAVTPFLTCIKIQDGGRPPSLKKKNRHISAAFWDIFNKFGMRVPTDSPQRAVTNHFGAKTKSKMATGRHFEKRKIAIIRPPFELLSPNLAWW